ncbi:MAG TPA: hypothetical protein PLS03_06620, partial [Terrimicrobiaceae bacterium]|nr:hypothetical protein [Terrimicrobiaceae bacterium]
VDEALAVGDLPFVTKCLRRINDFRADGGTLVLVNHSGYAIRQNCNRAMWLSSGEVKMYGEAQEVATEYEMFLAQESGSQGATATTHLTPPIESLEIECPESVENGDSMDILVKVEASGEVANGCVSLTFFDASNTLLFFTTPKDDPAAVGIHQGSNVWKFHYPSIPLMRGAYKLSVVVFAERFENQYASQLLAKEFKVNLAAHESTSGIFTVPSVTTKIA